MAKIRGTKVCTARASIIGDYDIQRTIERESGYLARQGKTVINSCAKNIIRLNKMSLNGKTEPRLEIPFSFGTFFTVPFCYDI